MCCVSFFFFFLFILFVCVCLLGKMAKCALCFWSVLWVQTTTNIPNLHICGVVDRQEQENFILGCSW